MNFIELAHKRRSVRKFTAQTVSEELILKIIDATLTAPSSKNLRTTRLAVTDDTRIMGVISAMRSTGSAFVDNAPLAFFVMGDDSQTDLWRENCAISATVLQFAAESLGLGSCWVQVYGRPHRDEEPGGETAEQYLKRLIPGLPDHRIMCVVAVGYPQAESRPRSPRDDSDKVYRL